MKKQVKNISKSDFDSLKCLTLFENKLTDKVFAYISDNKICYKYGWSSETVSPIILNVRNNIFLIGIDQNLVVFDFDKEKIELKLELDYFFYDAKIYNKCIYVISELEILKIDIKTTSVINETELPEYFQKIEFINDKAHVYCIDGQKVTIE